MQNQMLVFLRHRGRSWPATHQEIDIGPTQGVAPLVQQELLVPLGLQVPLVPLALKEVLVPLALPEYKVQPVKLVLLEQPELLV